MTKFYTYTGIVMDLVNPKSDDIRMEDIAHSLSFLPRANGHFPHLYSEGQHAILCCKEARARGLSKRIQLACLMNHATACYLPLVPLALQREQSEYMAVQRNLRRLILEKVGLGELSVEEERQVAELDDIVSAESFRELMELTFDEEIQRPEMDHDFSQRSFASVKQEFLLLFKGLTEEKRPVDSVGIDGAREGWVAVALSEEGFEVELFETMEMLCERYVDSGSLLVDMPIGLPESQQDMRPDAEARRWLSGRGSCIFNTPCRQAVYTDEYREASDTNRMILGKGLSKQSFSISGRIREVDLLLARQPKLREKLRESHPEIGFAALASEERFVMPLYHGKQTDEGFWDRVEVLRDYYDRTDEFVSFILSDEKWYRLRVDCMDALCLAVSGLLGNAHGFATIPAKPSRDARGLAMEIVVGKKNDTWRTPYSS